MDKTPAMQDDFLMEIRVECGEAVPVKGQETTVVMIPFTGTADGPYFRGGTVGTGVGSEKTGAPCFPPGICWKGQMPPATRAGSSLKTRAAGRRDLRPGS